MKKLLLISLLLVPTIVQAQTLPPSTEINLKVTLANADKIWRGLRKLPVEEVEELMNEIRQQVSAQTQPKPVETPSPEPKSEK